MLKGIAYNVGIEKRTSEHVSADALDALRAGERRAFYHDEAVKFTHDELRQMEHQLKDLPLCLEHDRARPIGQVIDNWVDSDGHLGIAAYVQATDDYHRAVVARIDAGELAAFSVCYLPVRQPGSTHITHKRMCEVSLVKDPFFPGCNVTVAASLQQPPRMSSASSDTSAPNGETAAMDIIAPPAAAVAPPPPAAAAAAAAPPAAAAAAPPAAAAAPQAAAMSGAEYQELIQLRLAEQTRRAEDQARTRVHVQKLMEPLALALAKVMSPADAAVASEGFKDMYATGDASARTAVEGIVACSGRMTDAEVKNDALRHQIDEQNQKITKLEHQLTAAQSVAASAQAAVAASAAQKVTHAPPITPNQFAQHFKLSSSSSSSNPSKYPATTSTSSAASAYDYSSAPAGTTGSCGASPMSFSSTTINATLKTLADTPELVSASLQSDAAARRNFLVSEMNRDGDFIPPPEKPSEHSIKLSEIQQSAGNKRGRIGTS